MYPTKEELKGKWWRRLAIVIIWGITILATVGGIWAAIDSIEINWDTHYLLSFEKGFKGNKYQPFKLILVTDYNRKKEILKKISARYPDSFKGINIENSIRAWEAERKYQAIHDSFKKTVQQNPSIQIKKMAFQKI